MQMSRSLSARAINPRFTVLSDPSHDDFNRFRVRISRLEKEPLSGKNHQAGKRTTHSLHCKEIAVCNKSNVIKTKEFFLFFVLSRCRARGQMTMLSKRASLMQLKDNLRRWLRRSHHRGHDYCCCWRRTRRPQSPFPHAALLQDIFILR